MKNTKRFKKIAALILIVAMMMTVMSCGKIQKDHDEALMNLQKASNLAVENGSIKVKANGEEAMGFDFDMILKGLDKVTDTDIKPLEGKLLIDMDESDLNMTIYFKDGYSYYDMDGEKIKQPLMDRNSIIQGLEGVQGLDQISSNTILDLSKIAKNVKFNDGKFSAKVDLKDYIRLTMKGLSGKELKEAKKALAKTKGNINLAATIKDANFTSYKITVNAVYKEKKHSEKVSVVVNMPIIKVNENVGDIVYPDFTKYIEPKK
ncbi:MAG: hypothetical protein RR495_05790 [Anaerovoracaceae bacterium]